MVGMVGLTTHSIAGHMGHFHFLAITNNLLRAFVYKFLCQQRFSFLWDKCSGVQLLGHIIYVCLDLLEISILFSRVAIPFYIRQNV